MKRKNIILLILLVSLLIGTTSEATMGFHAGPGFFRGGDPRFVMSGWFGTDRFFMNPVLPLWWGERSGFKPFFHPFYFSSYSFWGRHVFDQPYSYGYSGYNYPYFYGGYGGAIVTNPYSSESTYGSVKTQDGFFYSGIQVYPAGRVKITTTKDGDKVADVEIDGFPAGKIGTENKPFELGLLVGKHKIILKKDGKEVFSADIDIERNKEINLNIDLERLDK